MKEKNKLKDKITWIAILFAWLMLIIGGCKTQGKLVDCGEETYGIDEDISGFNSFNHSEPTFHLFNKEKVIDTDTISLLTLQSLKDFLDWRKKNSNPFRYIPPDLVEYYKFLTEVYDKEPIYLKDLIFSPGISTTPLLKNLPKNYFKVPGYIQSDTIELCPHTIMTTTSMYCDPPRNDCNDCICDSCGKTWKCP